MYASTQSRNARPLSPPMSAIGSSHTFTATTQQPKLNVVTRLAIEGKAKEGQDGIAIRMYLKFSIPMDSVSPGLTLPLFHEGNLKMLSSEVHPIDNNSVPYNFSPTTSPLLNNTARALNLPPRSQKSYLSVFGLSTSSASVMGHSSRSSSSTSTSHGPSIPPLDDKYTGHILVSGYNISYVLPKEFPPRFGEDSAMRVSTYSAAKMRRGSVGERNNMHFMAGIDLWVPYVSRPPKAPYLISIPLPRCLSNNVRLRIFPPSSTTTSTSFASLSSAEEDPGAWELTSEPHVTRTTTRRSGSYADMADDESSDSSAYTDRASGGIAIQGTFPSAERLRVRWASPLKTMANNDGRRRVGVKEVKGEMTCHVLGKDIDPKSGREGILMKLEYKGTAKGVWFPGVATMLGMDVGLEARGSDVIWAPGEESTWSVAGGAGYTGFDVNPPSAPASRQPSLEFPDVSESSSRIQVPVLTTRHDSTSSASSTASLLRAPLPSDHLPDYSFEGSPTSLTPSGTLSSISSMPLTSEGRSRANSDAQSVPPSPTSLTIHINMNDILPPSKNAITFNIGGTILVISRPRASNGYPWGSNSSTDTEADPIPIVLPRFSVLAADTETTATIIRNECEAATVEVYNISGNLSDAQTRRTVLQRGGMSRCGSEGGRIALRSIARSLIPTRATSTADDTLQNARHPTGRPLTPTGIHRTVSAVSLTPMFGTTSTRRRDGPLMIPSVMVFVTPLLPDTAGSTDAYAVRVLHPAPCDIGSEWMEFGLARADGTSLDLPSVEIASVSIDGMPVRFEMSAANKHGEKSFVDLSSSLDNLGSKSWVAWIKVHVGGLNGDIQVDYVVKNSDDGSRRGKAKVKDDGYLGILLPTFTIPVGKLEVNVESSEGLDVRSLRSNLAHQQVSPQGRKLLHFVMEEMFSPKLSLKIQPRVPMTIRLLGKLFHFILWTAPALLVLMVLLNLGSEFRHIRYSLDRCTPLRDSQWQHDPPPMHVASTETVFVTTTMYAPAPVPTYAEPPFSHTAAVSTAATPSTSSLAPSSVMEARSNMHTRSPLLPLDSPPPSSSRTGREETATTLTPTPSSDERSLSLINVLPFPWQLPLDLPPIAQHTVDTVLEGFAVIWQVCRKVYHYPLDPP